MDRRVHRTQVKRLVEEAQAVREADSRKDRISIGPIAEPHDLQGGNKHVHHVSKSSRSATSEHGISRGGGRGCQRSLNGTGDE